ncbi:hypothetical protein DM02DRAFT_622900 [Periconia macrospinosa]|uniref:Uncharacterized protein n=1 Tax=Periconia macrospinosa TaxID=97972 RepID=A0A2V1E9A8_9PLEO|nr:hypothetical protein DM02DRAFT_622900 [Periconia macrospinosa]
MTEFLSTEGEFLVTPMDKPRKHGLDPIEIIAARKDVATKQHSTTRLKSDGEVLNFLSAIKLALLPSFPPAFGRINRSFSSNQYRRGCGGMSQNDQFVAPDRREQSRDRSRERPSSPGNNEQGRGSIQQHGEDRSSTPDRREQRRGRRRRYSPSPGANYDDGSDLAIEPAFDFPSTWNLYRPPSLVLTSSMGK